MSDEYCGAVEQVGNTLWTCGEEGVHEEHVGVGTVSYPVLTHDDTGDHYVAEYREIVGEYRWPV